MNNPERLGLKTPGTTDDASLSSGCPVCGRPLDAITNDGPRGAVAQPCGHSVDQLTYSTLQTHE